MKEDTQVAPEQVESSAKSSSELKAEGKPNESLLQEIRENYIFASSYWREIREDAREDMRYIAGDAWDPKEKQARKDANRPCLNFDEINQYINQVVNGLRQNKRAIKINPKGNGADDNTASFHQNLIRGIEYDSNAQSAYITAAESMCQRSYGFFRVSRAFESDSSFNQKLVIKRIPNPDTVLLDPNAKEQDFSDGEFCFVTDTMSKSAFKRRFPKAELTSMSEEKFLELTGQSGYKEWVQSNQVQIAEYWRVEYTDGELVELNDGTAVLASELTEEHAVIGVTGRTRKLKVPQIVQYLTNGIEILEKKVEPKKCRLIPVVPMIGREMYLSDGATTKRKWMSLTRLARDPQMLYSYYRTCEAEIVGMAPKTPYVGYEGQFDTSTDWANLNKIPVAYAEVKATTTATGDQILPLPQRQVFEPPIQALEVGAEAARRAIQAAMGITPLPTNAQRLNDKSGVALKQIEQSADQGTYNFIDSFDMALEHCGRIIEERIPAVYDTAREMALPQPDETRQIVKINDPSFKDPKTNEPMHLDVTKGEHQVTVSTGPSYQSQRDAADQFLDTIAGTPMGEKVMDLLVKSKNLGPLGDEIAERLTPPEFQSDDDLTPRAKQIIMQEQQQLQAMHEYAKTVEAKLQELEQQQQSRSLELESQERIKQAEIESRERIELEKLKLEYAKIESQEALKALELQIKTIESKQNADLQREARVADAAAKEIGSDGESQG